MVFSNLYLIYTNSMSQPNKPLGRQHYLYFETKDIVFSLDAQKSYC